MLADSGFCFFADGKADVIEDSDVQEKQSYHADRIENGVAAQ